MTTRVSVATQFSGMANPAPVELLAAGYTNPTRIYVCSPARVTGDRRRGPEDETILRLAGPGSSPDGCSTPAMKGKASTTPRLQLLDWGRRWVRPSNWQPGDRISPGGPGGGAHPPSPALVPRQQLLQPSPPR